MNLLERYSDFIEKVQLHYKIEVVTSRSLRKYCEEVHKDFDSYSIDRNKNHIIINFKEEDSNGSKK